MADLFDGCGTAVFVTAGAARLVSASPVEFACTEFSVSTRVSDDEGGTGAAVGGVGVEEEVED